MKTTKNRPEMQPKRTKTGSKKNQKKFLKGLKKGLITVYIPTGCKMIKCSSKVVKNGLKVVLNGSNMVKKLSKRT